MLLLLLANCLANLANLASHIAINLQLQPAGLTQLYGQCVTALCRWLQLLLDLCGLKELEIVTIFSRCRCLTVEPGLLLPRCQRPLGFSFGQADNEKYS